MNDKDDMNQFVYVLMRLGVVFLLLIAILLLCIAALLIWKPLVLLEILRCTVAAICVGTAFWIIVAMTVGIFKKRG